MEKELVREITSVLRKLTIPIELEERQRATEANKPWSGLPEGRCTMVDNTWYLVLERPMIVLSCPADSPGACDVLLAAGAMAAAMSRTNAPQDDIRNAYVRILHGDCTGSQLEALTHEYHLTVGLRRAVMAFHVIETNGETAETLLRTVIPMEKKDVLVSLDRHTAVLIKNMTGMNMPGDLTQYAEALQETVQQENICRMTVGIGRTCETIAGLHASCDDALRAIEIGRLFCRRKNGVYEYSRLMLERLLAEIPAEVASAYCEQLFGHDEEGLFTDEMLFSLETFFRKNLNLSETARQLYIHRNTLVYRLDKIEKATGLDLKNFNDAVTFKIMMELRRSAAGVSEDDEWEM